MSGTSTLAPVATPTRKAVNITNKPELRAALKRLAQIKQIEREAAALERERKALEASLRGVLDSEGAEDFIVRGNVVARLSSLRHNTYVPPKKLSEVFPEAYAACAQTTYYKFIQVL